MRPLPATLIGLAVFANPAEALAGMLVGIAAAFLFPIVFKRSPK